MVQEKCVCVCVCVCVREREREREADKVNIVNFKLLTFMGSGQREYDRNSLGYFSSYYVSLKLFF